MPRDSILYDEGHQWNTTFNQPHGTELLPRTIQRSWTIRSKYCSHGNAPERKPTKRPNKIIWVYQRREVDIHEFAKRCAHITASSGTTKHHQVLHPGHRHM